MGERVALDGIQPDEFDRFIDLLAGWIASGEVKVRFRLPSQVVFGFVEVKVTQALEKEQLPAPACKGQLSMDIPVMLGGILTGYRNVAADLLVQHADVKHIRGEPKPDKRQVRDEVQARLGRVEQQLVTPDLRRQYAVKRAAKTSVYHGLSWEVVEKQSQSGEDSPPNLAYAMIRLVAQRPPFPRDRQLFVPFWYSHSDEAGFDTVALTMTAEDLDELVENLRGASEALRRGTKVGMEV